MLLPLTEKVRAAQLPGMGYLTEVQETIDGILHMPTDDCVKTLAGEGKSYQEARAHVHRLHDVLTPPTLQLLRSARLAERIDEFKEHLLKLLAEGARIILE